MWDDHDSHVEELLKLAKGLQAALEKIAVARS